MLVAKVMRRKTLVKVKVSPFVGGTMPFKSEAQRRYFEANKSKLEKQGVDVAEWEQASKGMKLPERAPKKASKKKSARS
jgi:hypothetical protein